MTMTILWFVTAGAALAVSFTALNRYRKGRRAYHLSFLSVFFLLGLGSGIIGYLYVHKWYAGVYLVWGTLLFLTLLGWIPVFCRFFFLLAADLAGFYIEAGILAMVFGLLVLITTNYGSAAWIGLLCLLLFFIGYERLCQKLKSVQDNPPHLDK